MIPRPGSPPWRVLLALAAGILTAHVLMLQASPARFGPEADEKGRQRAFATRSVEAAPPPQAVAAPLQIAPAHASRPKKPATPVERAEPAIDSIALPAAEGDVPALSAAGASTPTSAEPVAEPAPPVATMPPQATGTAAVSAAPPALPANTRVEAVKLAESVRISYAMTGVSKGLTYYAGAELSWHNNGNQYEAAMKVSALFLGSRSMTSQGGIGPSGLAPTRFLDKSRSEQAAHFLADQGKITFSANTPDAPWIEGAQDRISVFMQLAGMLAGNPAAFAPGSSITVYTVGPREADTWTFLVEGEEKLNLPGGEFSGLKLSRKPRREFDQKVEIWFAPSLAYLPVRSRITQQNGDFVDQQLKDVTRP